jgi:hypothetical protein
MTLPRRHGLACFAAWPADAHCRGYASVVSA